MNIPLNQESEAMSVRDDMRLEVELKGLIAFAHRMGRHDLHAELIHVLELHRVERVSRQTSGS